jgi:hypothetical protein
VTQKDKNLIGVHLQIDLIYCSEALIVLFDEVFYFHELLPVFVLFHARMNTFVALCVHMSGFKIMVKFCESVAFILGIHFKVVSLAFPERRHEAKTAMMTPSFRSWDC